MKLNNKGMTLVETLLAILIGSFVTLIVGAGLTTSINCYREISLKTQAQSILSTYLGEMRETLSAVDYSKGVNSITTAQGHRFDNVFFSNSYKSYGTYILVEYENETNVIVFQPLVYDGHYWNELDKQYIMNSKSSVSNSFSAADISVNFTEFNFDPVEGCFTGRIEMYVNSESSADTLCEAEFTFYSTERLLKN